MKRRETKAQKAARLLKLDESNYVESRDTIEEARADRKPGQKIYRRVHGVWGVIYYAASQPLGGGKSEVVEE